MKPIKSIMLFAVALSFALTSCNLYPGEAASTEDLDVMISQYDPNANFSVMKTYALSPEVTPVSNDPNNPPSFTISEELNNVIITTIKSNMAGYGWILVDSTDSPDLAIDLTATKARNTTIYYSYPGWGYPGYGWGYPYFPYASTVTSYEVGTIYMNGLDLNRVDTINQIIPVIWTGLIQGPLIDNVKDPLARVQRDINIVFKQSPYLNLN
jgi:hypothetical protein